MYKAIVDRIKTKPHPNADRLKLGKICNEQVIVGLDTVDDQLMVYFPCDGQLSEQFANKNDLVGYTDPATGDRRGGFFGKNRRVRAQKLRGVVSEGFACPLELLVKAGVSQKTVDKLAAGDQFAELDGILICNKYVTVATKKAGRGNKIVAAKKKNIRFPEHLDTKQFKYEVSRIPKNSIIYITEKLHGTSARYCYAQEEVVVKQPWYKRIFGAEDKTKLVWQRGTGTRRVILKDEDHQTKYHGGSAGFRFDVMRDKMELLHKGEVVYGEIVGYDSNGNLIMPAVSTDKIKDKEFKKLYGNRMVYKYGCPEGEKKFYVYRIAMVNEDGHLTELSWQQVRARCKELGLEYVPDLEGPIFYNENWQPEELLQVVQQMHEKHKQCTLDSSHISEGVCLRIEAEGNTYFLKDKNIEFKILEGIAKDSEQYVDTEEVESE